VTQEGTSDSRHFCVVRFTVNGANSKTMSGSKHSVGPLVILPSLTAIISPTE